MIWVLIIAIILFLELFDQSPKGRLLVVAILCIIYTLIVGSRSNIWNDTPNYWSVFSDYAKPLWEVEKTRDSHFLSDKGYLILNSLIRSFTDNRFIFFTIIAGITNWLLYKNLKEYCVYPIAGLMVYIGRFGITRNFMQIRAAMAILIVTLAIKFVADRNLRKYLFWVLIASTIHFSMLLAIPLYWIKKLNLTPRKILIYCVGAIVIAWFYSEAIADSVSKLSIEYQIGLAYTMETSEYTEGKGLANGMIYFQMIVLLIYSFNERQLAHKTPYYYTIRDAYFLSTMLLILLASFGVLSGRSSTIFATMEIFILPALCKIGNLKYQYPQTVAVALLGLVFFYLKFHTFASEHPSFDCFLLQ